MKYVVLALCACLALAGCGSDPVAQPDPSPSTSSALATPTTKGPETPQEFLRRWIHAGDEMQRTGKTDEFNAMNLPACEGCATFRDSVNGIYMQHRHVRFGGTRILGISRYKAGRWRLDISSGLTTILSRDGTVVGRYPGGDSTLIITVKTTSAGFKVADTYRLGAS